MTIQVTKEPINLREKLNELETNKGLKGNEILQAETAQEVRSLIGAGRKNLIINGDFQVSQRGDYSTATTIVNNTYYLDRSFIDTNLATATIQRTSVDVAGMPTKGYAQKVVATTSATAYLGTRQKIEFPDNYIGRTVTYSAYVRSNSTNARLASYISATSNQIIVSNTHSGGGAWEKLSVTFTVGAGAAAWWCDAFICSETISTVTITSGEYIESTGLQLELGSVATDFEHRSYGEELALCQRYYQKHISGDLYTGFGYTHKDRIYGYRYIKPMRIPPTLSYSALGHFSIRNVNNTVIGTPTAITHSRPGSQFTNLQFTHASIVSTSAYHIVANGTSNAWIAFDAEL